MIDRSHFICDLFYVMFPIEIAIYVYPEKFGCFHLTCAAYLVEFDPIQVRRYQSCKFRPKSLFMPMRSLFIFPFAPIFLTFPAMSKLYFPVRSLLHIPANSKHLFQRGHYSFFQPSQYSFITWCSNAGPITHLCALFKTCQYIPFLSQRARYHEVIKGGNNDFAGK